MTFQSLTDIARQEKLYTGAADDMVNVIKGEQAKGSALADQLRAVQNASSGSLANEIEEDPITAALAKLGLQKIDKPPGKERVSKAEQTKQKTEAGEKKFSEKADECELKTRGDIKSVTLRAVRHEFRNGRREAAMKNLEATFGGRPGLIDEALEFLENESAGSLKESISEARTEFQTRQTKGQIDNDRAMNTSARDLAASKGEPEAAGAYKELYYVIDENTTVHDVSTNLIGKHATIKEMDKHTYHLLHVLGALTKNPHIESAQLVYVNRGGRKVQAIRVVIRNAPVAVERMRNEAARLPETAA